MTERETLFYYKKNVPYTVGVRLHHGDTKGKALTSVDPYIAIVESGLRDFKRANRYALMEGLIIETKEPSVDEESPNSISDETAAAVVKNVVALKKVLSEVTSDAPLQKLLEEAKIQRKSAAVKLIEKRLKDMYPDESPFDMESVN